MLQEAKDSNKVLLMYIDCRATPDRYLGEILCNEFSVMIINQYYVAWGVDIETAEGEIAGNVLQVRDLPCIAAVKVDNVNSPFIIEKLEGIYSDEKIIEFLSRNYVIRPVIPKKNKQLEEERKIRARQERELKEAERIVKERQELEVKKKQEEVKRIEMERVRKEAEERQREVKMEIIGSEPEGDSAAIVSFRLPDGSKLVRRFDRQRKIQVLYDFMEVQGFNQCALLFGFPSAPLENKEESLESIGIFPTAVLIVRKLE